MYAKLIRATIFAMSMSAQIHMLEYVTKAAQSMVSYIDSGCDHSNKAYWLRHMPRSVLK